ncbi:unspecific monooxygenase [Sarracenia purpurea var. burkii]
MTLEFMTLLLTLFILVTTLPVLPIHHHFKNKPPHLRHPPTPLALPILGHLHLLRPVVHHSFHQLSARYGPIFRLSLGSVPCVVVSTPELAKEVLKTHELTFSARKHSAPVKRLTYDSSFAFSPVGPYWNFIKKLCTYDLLGSRNLNHFLPIRTREFNSFLQLLMNKAMAGEAVNVTEELFRLTNNIISQMMLSIRCSETKGEADEARTLVREVTRVFGEFNVSDFVGFCRNLDLQGIGRKCEDIHRRYDAFAGEDYHEPGRTEEGEEEE